MVGDVCKPFALGLCRPVEMLPKISIALQLPWSHSPLPRERTVQEIQRLHDDLVNLTPEQATRRRQKNHRLVLRLAPGRGRSNFAMMGTSRNGCNIIT